MSSIESNTQLPHGRDFTSFTITNPFCLTASIDTFWSRVDSFCFALPSHTAPRMLRYRLSEICLTTADVEQSKQYRGGRSSARRASRVPARSRLDGTSTLPQLCHGSERSRDKAVVHVDTEELPSAESAELFCATSSSPPGKEGLPLSSNKVSVFYTRR